MAKKGQKLEQYLIQIKEEAVRLHEKEGLSYREIAKELGVRNKTQVHCWVEKRPSNPGVGQTTCPHVPFQVMSA